MTETTVWRALNDGLRTAMRRDERVLVLGEDLTRWGSGGGVYGVTRGLLDEFGKARVRDTPISEEAMVAAAVGCALCGMRPVAEIMNVDFSLLAFEPIVNQAAKIRYMFAGQFDVPLVLRMATGSGSSRGPHHAQSLETLFASVPGLEVVAPATPSDARALLLASIASPNPTVFLESKALYNVRGEVGDDDVPLGLARIARPGRDATVIATQLLVHRALAVAERLASEGVEIEIVDLRTLYPLDMDTVLRSVRRTRRAIVCHEAPRLYGFGAEIAAAIGEACWGELAAPVMRLGARHAPMPYAPTLEAAVIPSEERLEESIRALIVST